MILIFFDGLTCCFDIYFILPIAKKEKKRENACNELGLEFLVFLQDTLMSYDDVTISK